MEWKTIDSAPKDGTRIVIKKVDGSIKREFVAHWDEMDFSWPRWRLESGGAWTEGDGCGPTHWRPLDPSTT